jgi:hypothetical protein
VDDNSALSFTVDALDDKIDGIMVEPDGKKISAVILSGTQTIPKYMRPAPDRVVVFMALYRIANKRVDLVLSMNITFEGERAVGEDGVALAKAEFEIAATSLRVQNYDLFA